MITVHPRSGGKKMRNMVHMKDDPVMLGAFAGIIGTFAKETFNFISFAVGWSEELYWRMAASIFVLPRDVNKPVALLLGALGDIITGAFFGVLFVYFLRLTGPGFRYFKGLGFAWMIWLGLFGLITNLDIIRVTPLGIDTALSAFISHTFFGLGLAWVVRKWGMTVVNSKGND